MPAGFSPARPNCKSLRRSFCPAYLRSPSDAESPGDEKYPSRACDTNIQRCSNAHQDPPDRVGRPYSLRLQPPEQCRGPSCPRRAHLSRGLGEPKRYCSFRPSLCSTCSRKNVAEPKRWIRVQAAVLAGALPGSTNSYANSYTIRATENANRFPAIQHAAVSEPGDLGTQASRLLSTLEGQHRM